MRSESGITLPVAVAALALFALPIAQSESERNRNAQDIPNENAPALTSAAPPQAKNEASRMVPVRVRLDGTLDTRRTQPGHAVQATLREPVQLQNGQFLPKGATLLGVVTKDSTESAETKLALRFDRARLKNAETFPVQATIVSVYSPSPMHRSNPTGAADEPSNFWNGRTVQISQVNALPGVDLHSQIAGANSGVLVTNRKNEVKLRKGSRLALAIAPAYEQGQRTDQTGF